MKFIAKRENYCNGKPFPTQRIAVSNFRVKVSDESKPFFKL